MKLRIIRSDSSICRKCTFMPPAYSWIDNVRHTTWYSRNEHVLNVFLCSGEKLFSICTQPMWRTCRYCPNHYRCTDTALKTLEHFEYVWVAICTICWTHTRHMHRRNGIVSVGKQWKTLKLRTLVKHVKHVCIINVWVYLTQIRLFDLN